LTGLEYALNLRTLECIHSRLTSLAPLAGLVNLETLAFNENEISDLSPLAGLSNLRSLILHDNEISDISALGGLSNLEMLDLHFNRISDASAISSLTRLETLMLDGNQISHIPSLSELDGLRTLRLGVNEIGDLTPLSGLSNLETLSIYANQISDVSPWPASSLKTLYLPGTRSGISPLADFISQLSGRQNNPLSAGLACPYPQILAKPGHLPAVRFRYVSPPVHFGNGRRIRWSIPAKVSSEFDDGETVRLAAMAKPGFKFVSFSGTYHSSQNPAFITMVAIHHPGEISSAR
jgi:hypothetical protein